MNNRSVSVLLLLLFSSVILSASSVNFQNWTLAQARSAASEHDKLFFLYFTAEWCMPCQWMEQHTFADATLGSYINQHYLAVKVDHSTGQGATLGKQFDVQNIPSILVFNASGQLIDQRSGSQEARPLLRWLRRLDKPVNHLKSAQIAIASSPPSLQSPKPKLQFSRPPLEIPDNTNAYTASSVQASPSNDVSPVILSEPIAAQATNNNTDRFQARDGTRFTILLTHRALPYTEAIRLVAELERKFEHRVELAPQSDGMQLLHIGTFERASAARSFLHYLNRNNWQGQVVPIAAGR